MPVLAGQEEETGLTHTQPLSAIDSFSLLLILLGNNNNTHIITAMLSSGCLPVSCRSRPSDLVCCVCEPLATPTQAHSLIQCSTQTTWKISMRLCFHVSNNWFV